MNSIQRRLSNRSLKRQIEAIPDLPLLSFLFDLWERGPHKSEQTDDLILESGMLFRFIDPRGVITLAVRFGKVKRLMLRGLVKPSLALYGHEHWGVQGIEITEKGRSLVEAARLESVIGSEVAKKTTRRL